MDEATVGMVGGQFVRSTDGVHLTHETLISNKSAMGFPVPESGARQHPSIPRWAPCFRISERHSHTKASCFLR